MFLSHARGMVHVARGLSLATRALRLKVDFETYPVVVNGYVLLNMEGPRNQHNLTSPSIGTRHENRLLLTGRSRWWLSR